MVFIERESGVLALGLTKLSWSMGYSDINTILPMLLDSLPTEPALDCVIAKD